MRHGLRNFSPLYTGTITLTSGFGTVPPNLPLHCLHHVIIAFSLSVVKLWKGVV